MPLLYFGAAACAYVTLSAGLACAAGAGAAVRASWAGSGAGGAATPMMARMVTMSNRAVARVSMGDPFRARGQRAFATGAS